MKQIILSFFGSLVPSIIFNASRKNLVWTGLSGVTGWILYIWVLNTTGDVVLSVFAGSIAIGLYSEIMARVLKSPATIYSLCGIFPIVPGVPAYNTIEYLVKHDLIKAASTGIETIASAGAIAFGIMLMSAVFRFFAKIREKYIS